jgi:excisionase family DNA binding protein
MLADPPLMESASISATASVDRDGRRRLAATRRTDMPGRTVADVTSTPTQHAQRRRDTAVPERMLLTVEEAAHVLGVGRSLMYELIARGAIKTVRIGRLRRIRPEALADYIASLDG